MKPSEGMEGGEHYDPTIECAGESGTDAVDHQQVDVRQSIEHGPFYVHEDAPRVDPLNWGPLMDEPAPRRPSSRLARPE